MEPRHRQVVRRDHRDLRRYFHRVPKLLSICSMRGFRKSTRNGIGQNIILNQVVLGLRPLQTIRVSQRINALGIPCCPLPDLGNSDERRLDSRLPPHNLTFTEMPSANLSSCFHRSRDDDCSDSNYSAWKTIFHQVSSAFSDALHHPDKSEEIMAHPSSNEDLSTK